MRKTFFKLSREELERNKSSHVFLGDISVGGFLDENEQMVERAHNLGIAEQAMIGFASGVSLVHPQGNVIVHTISPFLVERTFEQIKLCCGYNGAKLILISANGPYDYERLGPTHHSASDVNLLATIPDMQLRLPSTVEDLEEIYQQALTSDKSTYIRLTARGARPDCETTKIEGHRRLRIENGVTTDSPPRFDHTIVCIGESLAYVLANQKRAATVYWTSDPFAPLPKEARDHENITVLEPYTQPLISAPDRAVRKNFSKQHKKIIQPNLGWEDFK